jgi:hypothetical protein
MLLPQWKGSGDDLWMIRPDLGIGVRMKNLIRDTMAGLPAKLAIEMEFFLHHRKWPRLRNPQTFNEWIQFRKLYERDPRFVQLADKISVKDHVGRAIGSQYLMPTIWSGRALPPRDQRNWPVPSVIKASHGSGQNLFIRSRNAENWDEIEVTVDDWCKKAHAQFAGEWLYKQIQPGILVEPYRGDGDALPLDYKFFVFGGHVEYIEVDTDQATNHRRCFYDRHWRRQPFGLAYPLETRELEAPDCLSEKLEIAERLGRDLDFVRIDMYAISGRPYFGKMTFYPDSGLGVFRPEEFDAELGSLWAAAVANRRSARLRATLR